MLTHVTHVYQKSLEIGIEAWSFLDILKRSLSVPIFSVWQISVSAWLGKCLSILCYNMLGMDTSVINRL